MAFTIYDASVPPMIHMLGGLSTVLGKGEAHAKESGAAEASYLEARLAPDMFALTRQVQIATDMAKGGGARLSGVEPPAFEDKESSFADLRARIAKTVDFLKGLDKAQFTNAETRAIQLKFPTREMNFTGADYLNNFVLPNVYFHITTAYDILRNKGVTLSKQDFLGG